MALEFLDQLSGPHGHGLAHIDSISLLCLFLKVKLLGLNGRELATLAEGIDVDQDFSLLEGPLRRQNLRDFVNIITPLFDVTQVAVVVKLGNEPFFGWSGLH